MDSNIFSTFLWPMLLSAGLILLNEMGDKSQLLAMAFATRMKLRKVFLGIFLAVLSLNVLAVIVGSLLASVPGWENWINLISSVLFLVFGIWTLKADSDESEEKPRKKGVAGEIAVVFASFFFSEMGDKTQLVTISLAARYSEASVMVLIGATIGMVLADGIGIFVGFVMHKKLPEKALKVISAALFIFFGVSGLWQALYNNFNLPLSSVVIITTVAGLITVLLGYLVYTKSGKKNK